MASRFVEADEEFNEELKNTSDNKNTKRSTDYWTKTLSNNGQRQGEKISNLKATKYQSNEALVQFFAQLRKENGKDCFNNFTLYVINK